MFRIMVLFAVVMTCLTACSWQGTQQWRKSVCEPIADAEERARCLEEAMRSENDYKQEVDEVTK